MRRFLFPLVCFFGLVYLTGCQRRPPEYTPTEEERKKTDEEMKKAIEKNQKEAPKK
jgi:predicted small lipoprotein YifL